SDRHARRAQHGRGDAHLRSRGRAASRGQARRGHAARGPAQPRRDRGVPRERRGVTPLLQIETIDVAYGKRRALEDVSLSVGDGEIVTLLGANGAGKSTTLRAISGLVRPGRGRVVYRGDDITRVAPHA